MFFSPVNFILQIIILALAGIVTVFVSSFFGHTKIIIFYLILFSAVALLVSSIFSWFGGIF